MGGKNQINWVYLSDALVTVGTSATESVVAEWRTAESARTIGTSTAHLFEY